MFRNLRDRLFSRKDKGSLDEIVEGEGLEPKDAEQSAGSGVYQDGTNQSALASFLKRNRNAVYVTLALAAVASAALIYLLNPFGKRESPVASPTSNAPSSSSAYATEHRLATSTTGPSSGMTLTPLSSLTPSPFPTVGLGTDAVIRPYIDPGQQGVHGDSLSGNFYTALGSLFSGGSRSTIVIGGEGIGYMAVPWFTSSTECSEGYLHKGWGDFAIDRPDFNNFLMVTDELSEAALLASLGKDEKTMLQIQNTVVLMEEGSDYGAPCWIAKVKDGDLSCVSADTASDATARLGLAFFQAAKNQSFSQESRDSFASTALSLAKTHVDQEFAKAPEGTKSPVTGLDLEYVVAGGGNTAKGGVSGSWMWAGYFPDSAKMLIAAAAAETDPAQAKIYETRAAQVVDAFLVASGYHEGGLFAPGNFTWKVESGTLGIGPAEDRFADPRGLAWDDYDAPRALGMGGVLRSAMQYYGDDLPQVYELLSLWVGDVGVKVKTDDGFCIQFNRDGSAVSSGCSTSSYNIGLAGELFLGDDSLQGDIINALGQFDSGFVPQGASCNGIYRGVRPLKLLASSIGLDSQTYASGHEPFLLSSDMPVVMVTRTPSPAASTPTPSQAGDSQATYSIGRVQELNLACYSSSGEELSLVYESTTNFPLYTDGANPQGIQADTSRPIGTGKVVVCYDPNAGPGGNGALYEVALWGKPVETNQKDIEMHHQPGFRGTYEDFGMSVCIRGSDYCVPQNPFISVNELGGSPFFPFVSSFPARTEEVRP